MTRLLEPLGPQLARRWVAALMFVDAEQRQAVVEQVERQIVAEYGRSEEVAVILEEPGA